MWAGSRIVLLTLIPFFGILTADINYYFAWAQIGNLTDGLQEYPLPMAWGLMLPGMALGNQTAYTVGYVASALVADGLVTWALMRRFGNTVALHWVWLIALYGALTYVRFDVYVAAALAGVLMTAASSPVRSGLFAALGSAVKMWPAVFGLGLVSDMRHRVRHMLAAIAGGLSWVIFTAVVAGPSRVFSPLTWQGERGFQVESVLGSVLGLAKGYGGADLTLELRQGSWEYVGPLATEWKWVVKPLSYLGYLAILGLLYLGWRAGSRTRFHTEALAITMLAVISTFMLTSPVLSPQYLIWIIPALALLRDRIMLWLGYAIMVLTQLNLPWWFNWFFGDDQPRSALIRTDVFARNVGLIILAAMAITRLVQLSRGPRLPSSSSQTSPAKPE